MYRQRRQYTAGPVIGLGAGALLVYVLHQLEVLTYRDFWADRSLIVGGLFAGWGIHAALARWASRRIVRHGPRASQ